MVNLPRYKNYKDSGVEWLGEIPEHWKVIRLKHISNILGRIGFRGYTIADRVDEGDGAISLSPSNIIDNQISYTEKAYISWDKYYESSEIQIFDEDIIFVKTGSTIGKVAIVKNPSEKMTINPQLVVLKNIKSNKQFLAYYMMSQPYQLQVLNLRVGGSTPTMTQDSLKQTFIVNLPIPEQKRIAEFLDRKCGEIDEAIAKKQRLIELLEEQKTILINQAVTKGLNPDTPMKDSGIEWLGEIPEHWEIKRAKYLLREVDERSQTGQEELLSVSHLTGVTPRSEKNVNMFMAEDYTGSKLCRKNDLVINIMWAWMGALGISEQLGIVSSSYGIFREIKSNTFNSWFLEHLLRSKEYVSQYNRVSTGLHSSRLRLYADTFLKIPIIFPRKEEQDHIETQVKSQLLKINQVIDQTQKQIEKLTELKQILIAEAITGKIKV